MEKLFFNKVSIIGVGFLGASLALSIREMKLCETINGYGRRLSNLENARVRGIIDNYSLDLRHACENADLIVLATPVGVFHNIVHEIKGIAKKGSIITDVGSIKGRLVYDIESAMPDEVSYIGSHPIAGGEKSGVENAKADLFNNALCIMTPTENSNPHALAKLEQLWQSLGCRVELMDPYRHDEVYALVSHLPHLVAYALVNSVSDVDAGFIRFAGQGFKDTTRIAMSPPEIWRDISALNKENLIKLIGTLKANLIKMEGFLKEGNFAGLENEFRRSQRLRERLK